MNLEQRVIDRAIREIEQRGWQWSLEPGELEHNKHLVHLELTRGSERIGWGLFEPSYCWTEAFEKVTGRDWIELII
ncbi:MAG: hypothetical protein CTY18_03015 [Methylomonas sp.]|nr:MAG: hypothetical protein CTY18_03015 [Methylomonas sp.]